MMPPWPDADRLHLARVRVPAALLDAAAPGVADEDGITTLDLVLEGGRIADLLPPGVASVAPAWDGDGGMLWPAFADLHTHLDKGHVWPRTRNVDGTLDGARAGTRADTTGFWRAEDVEARFEFSLQAAWAHGTAALRTHIDCFVPGQAAISFGVFRRLRDRWAGRIALQAAALVSTDLYDAPENAAIVDLIADSGGRLGGITFRLDASADPAPLDARLDRLLALAASRGLDIDLHVDENGAPSSNTLAQVARAVLRNRFKGQVVCGHVCSLSTQDEATVRTTIDLVRDAGLTIVSLPLVNQFLQGRIPGGTPRWRGIPLLRELKAAGVPVALASDNCRDPYHAFGDLDLLEVFGGAVRIAHLETELARWASAITAVPMAAMGLAGGLIGPGHPADFQLFRARTYSELLSRRQADRLVVRRGRPIAASLPDYRQLDPVVGRAWDRQAAGR